MEYKSPIPETVMSGDDLMMKSLAEHPDGFIILQTPAGSDSSEHIFAMASRAGVTHQDVYRALFIMIDGIVIKNRFGYVD